MKIKILIAPIAIIALVGLSIWIILPQANELRAEIATLKKAEKRLSETKDKIEKSDKLKRELAANVEKRDILMKYLPVDKQEEWIINNLNSLAAEDGLAIVALTLSSSPNKVPVVSDKSNKPVRANTADVDSIGMEEKPTEEYMNASVPVGLDANVSLVGSYEKIKSFLGKSKRLQRANETISFRISRPASNEDADTNNLQADLVLNFSYLKDITVADASSQILKSGKFDMLPVIEEIKNNTGTKFSEINVGSTGKSNPFIP